MNAINLTPQQLRKAADIQEKILTLQSELNEILGGEVPTPFKASEVPKKGKKFSAASRAKMRAAQKARWAKIRAEKESTSTATPSTEPAQKPKIQRSAAWKAAISAAAKARWAKAKRAGKSKW